MRKWQRITGLVLLGLSGLVIQQSVYVLRVFDGGQPGSGFMPLGLGLILAGLAVALIIVNREPDEKKIPLWAPGTWIRPLLSMLLFAGYALFLEGLGYVISVFALVFLWLVVVERKHLFQAALPGVLSAVGVWLIFGVLLKVPLPMGILAR
ncbi:MAG: tripartite tricarboxylate transporter TctB family protein [Syntrophothermus sp.]